MDKYDHRYNKLHWYNMPNRYINLSSMECKWIISLVPHYVIYNDLRYQFSKWPPSLEHNSYGFLSFPIGPPGPCPIMWPYLALLLVGSCYWSVFGANLPLVTCLPTKWVYGGGHTEIIYCVVGINHKLWISLVELILTRNHSARRNQSVSSSYVGLLSTKWMFYSSI